MKLKLFRYRKRVQLLELQLQPDLQRLNLYCNWKGNKMHKTTTMDGTLVGISTSTGFKERTAGAYPLYLSEPELSGLAEELELSLTAFYFL